MSRDALASFADLTPPRSESPLDVADDQPDTYPGSKQKRKAVSPPKDRWDGIPYTEFTLGGVMTRFYAVRVLADMLERKPPAIRKWERLGYIPETPYRSPGRTQHGQRRLYTRAQIEGLVDIAREEGLIGESNRNISATDFPGRAEKLFKELS